VLGSVTVLLVPVMAFTISHVSTSIFCLRYMAPGVLGWAVLVGLLAEWLMARPAALAPASRAAGRLEYVRRAVLGIVLVPMIVCPVAYGALRGGGHTATAIGCGDRFRNRPGADVEALHPDCPIVTLTSEDYLPRFHFDRVGRKYVWVMDLENARQSPNLQEIGNYKSMALWKKWYPQHAFMETADFLAKYERFLVIHQSDRTWVGFRIASDPAYRIQWLGPALLLVERSRPNEARPDARPRLPSLLDNAPGGGEDQSRRPAAEEARPPPPE